MGREEERNSPFPAHFFQARLTQVQGPLGLQVNHLEVKDTLNIAEITSHLQEDKIRYLLQPDVQ